MKSIYQTLLLSASILLGCSFIFAQAPVIQWQKALGGSGDDRARAIQETADGGYITTGYSKSNNGDVTGHHGNLIYADMWVVKLRANGSLQWQKNYGGSNEDQATDVKQTTDGGYIIAGYTVSNDGDVKNNHGSDDFWILKIDNAGRIQWQKTFGGSDYEVAGSIQQTVDGGYIVAGTTYSVNGDVTGNHGGGDFWVIKLNGDGDVVWQKTFGGPYKDAAHSVQQTTDGGYIIAGETRSTSGQVKNNHGGVDFWVIKLNANGHLVWQNTYGGTRDDEAHSVKQTPDGGYIVAGVTLSNDGNVTGLHGNQPDYWVIKIDAKGSLQWQRALGGTRPDEAFGVSVTQDGSYLVAGVAYSNDGDITGNHGNYEDWVVNLSNAGNLIWQLALGGSGADGAFDIQQNKDGSYIVTGFSGSNDGDVRGNHGGFFADFWVVNLKKAGAAAISKNEMQQSNDHSFKVIPHADRNSLAVQLSFKNNVEDKNVMIEVVNMQGQVIASKKARLINRNMQEEIELTSNLTGIYVVRASTRNAHFQQSVFLNQ
jgi:hypothetical protein